MLHTLQARFFTTHLKNNPAKNSALMYSTCSLPSTTKGFSHFPRVSAPQITLFLLIILSMAGLTENDGHEIGGQEIYRLKIDYITMQCAILFKTMAEYKLQQRDKLYRPPVNVEQEI